MSLRILHIVDDEIFLNGIVDSFEKWNPEKNIYLLNRPENKIHKSDDVSSLVTIATFGTGDYDKILLDFSSYDFLFIHGYYQNYKYHLVEKIKDTKWVHVSFWGADIYSKIPDYPLYLPTTNHTNELLEKRPGLRRQIKNTLKGLVKYTSKSKNDNYKWINSFSTVLLAEEELVKKTLLSAKCRYYAFNYGSALSPVEIDKTNSLQHILIGNSANSTSNHLDMIPILNDLNLSPDRRLILPLGYGGNPEYKKVVIKVFEESFDKRAHILNETLSFDEYLKVLNTCSHALMPQLRQQAFGNVFLLIHLGVKVFFYPQNLLYKTLKDLGVKVYLMKELPDEIDSNETSQNVSNNRRILSSYYNEINFSNLIQTMLKDLEINLSGNKNVSA